VVTYLLSFNFAAGPDPIPVAISPRVPSDAASVARGKKLYGEQGCVKCHGEDYRGGAKYEDAKGHPLIARDLTAPWTFRGGDEPEQLFLRLTTGMTPGPMPAYEPTTTPEERWDLVNFIRSIARIAPWERGGQLDGLGQDRDPVRRGDYLVHFEMCGLCHTQINETGIYREEGYFLAGGMRVGAYPHENVISRNLTSDLESGIGRFSVDQIATIIRTGRRPDRILSPWGMPWFYLNALLPEDAQAIAAYLKTMPPVYNLVPPPLKFGVLESLVAKLRSPLPAAVPVSLSYADGDFADPKGERGISRELPQELFKDLQWIVLLAGMVLLIMAGPSGPHLPKGLGQWLKAMGLSLGVLLLALIIWAIAELPASLPADQLAAGTQAGIWKPEDALRKRGQYLFTVSSCAFCHGNDGRGGAKISWKPFGTLWVRNITSDPETGLGAWTDEEIARAIRSGISKDGRQLHWQGMTWDLLSNLDEEDLRAVVAYVRALPPVKKAIPAARPPAPGDCEIYTFFLRGNLRQAGCN
jgi:mono/diheme cytochrome c family protein